MSAEWETTRKLASKFEAFAHEHAYNTLPSIVKKALSEEFKSTSDLEIKELEKESGQRILSGPKDAICKWRGHEQPVGMCKIYFTLTKIPRLYWACCNSCARQPQHHSKHSNPLS